MLNRDEVWGTFCAGSAGCTSHSGWDVSSYAHTYGKGLYYNKVSERMVKHRDVK